VSIPVAPTHPNRRLDLNSSAAFVGGHRHKASPRDGFAEAAIRFVAYKDLSVVFVNASQRTKSRAREMATGALLATISLSNLISQPESQEAMAAGCGAGSNIGGFRIQFSAFFLAYAQAEVSAVATNKISHAAAPHLALGKHPAWSELAGV